MERSGYFREEEVSHSAEAARLLVILSLAVVSVQIGPVTCDTSEGVEFHNNSCRPSCEVCPNIRCGNTRCPKKNGTPGSPICTSTGPACLADLSSCPNTTAHYQWCGGCQWAISCLKGVGSFFNTTNSSFPVWDQNQGKFVDVSRTCTECYYPCPLACTATAPSADPVQCNLTGPGCQPDVQFCTGSPIYKSFQNCANCSTYFRCASGSGNLITCPTGLYWDDNLKNCTTTSTTCTEYPTCYTPCTAPSNASTTEPCTATTTVQNYSPTKKGDETITGSNQVTAATTVQNTSPTTQKGDETTTGSTQVTVVTTTWILISSFTSIMLLLGIKT